MSNTKEYRMGQWLHRVCNAMNEVRVLQCIRESLIMIVPVIMIGAFSLLIQSFPIDVYQDFIKTFANGIIYTVLDYVYKATYGVLSIHMVASIALCYANSEKNAGGYFFGPIFVSLFAFWILSGAYAAESANMKVLGVDGMFTAMVSALSASALYCHVQRKQQLHVKFYAYGADDIFNSMLKYMVPVVIVILLFSAVNMLICTVCGVNSFQEMYTSVINNVFHNIGCTIWAALLYIFFEHILWFFGVHGANVLETVSDTLFAPALQNNIQVAAEGGVPTEIFNKTFFDVFVLMGGCGTTLCLLLAILLLSRKRKRNRNLAKLSLLPTLFNINEIVVFGVPIVFNPILMIPFFLVPIAALLVSYAATVAGWVPVIATQVEWTTPIFVGGYKATGSFAGVLLQLFNLILGILIYSPFVILLDRESERNGRKNLTELENILKESEERRKPIHVLGSKDVTGAVARILADELEDQVGRRLPTVYYQPQYNEHGTCIGAEALLRWTHPFYGIVYPPLVMKIADEIDVLPELEKDIFRAVVCDLDRLREMLGNDIKISVNVTGGTIQLDEYEQFLSNMAKQYPQYCKNILIELTEQESLKIDEAFIARLTRIKDLGYRLGIDDFSMGNTSIKYLQTNVFSLIKLDGALSLDVLENARSQGIVSMIAKLSKEFDLQVLAEYVETEEQRKILEEIGCCMYQGHLYSPAITIEDLDALERKGRKKNRF